MKTDFQNEGNVLNCKDWLNKKSIGGDNTNLHSYKNFGDKLSGPQFIFKLRLSSS